MKTRYLQVVTTALSVSCARHFKELQRKEKSMIAEEYVVARHSWFRNPSIDSPRHSASVVLKKQHSRAEALIAFAVTYFRVRSLTLPFTVYKAGLECLSRDITPYQRNISVFLRYLQSEGSPRTVNHSSKVAAAQGYKLDSQL